MIIEQLRNILILAILVAVVWSVSIFYKSNKNQVDQEIPKYSQQTMKEAIIYFNKSEEYEKALLLAKEYVNLYPDDTEGWVHRGFASYSLGNCIDALADFLHASMNGNKDANVFLASVPYDDLCQNEEEFTR